MRRFLSRGVAWFAVAVLPAAVAVAGGTLLCGTAGDDLVAARAGLVREWVVQIPFDSAGWSLETVSIGDGLVVATSGDGGVHAVSTGTGPGLPRPGSVLWSRRIGRSAGPDQRVGVGRDAIAVARDLGIVAFNRDDGSLKWQHSFGRPSSGGALLSGDWAYMPLSGDGIMRVPADPHRLSSPSLSSPADGSGHATLNARTKQKVIAKPPRSLSLNAGGRVESAPLAFMGGAVWWTAGGRIIAVVPPDGQDPDSKWERMEFDVGSPLAGSVVVGGPSIYAAVTGGDLVRIDEVADNRVYDLSESWRADLPYPPVGGPLLAGEIVIVSLGDQGIMAFSAVDGRERWRSCHGGRLVSITGNRVWCIDAVGRLSSLDLETGMPGEWMCLGSFTLPVVNTVNDRLILASPDGLLVSLAPRRTVSAVPPPAPPQPNWKPGEESAAPSPETVEPAGEKPAAESESTET